MTKDHKHPLISKSIPLLCASYQGDDSEQFLTEFRRMARQFDGVDDVVLVSAEERASQKRPGNTLTSIPIQVLDKVVGELQVYIRVKSFQHSSPLPLTRFLAHHLTLALHSAAIHASHRALNAELARLGGKVAEHRIVERARGILESQKLIPAGEAKRLLTQVSRNSGRNLREIARSIVSSERRTTLRLRRQMFGLGAPNHITG